MGFLIFLALGLGTIGLGFLIKEEVAQIVAVVTGTIFLIWGVTLTPKPFLMLAEVLTVIAVFRLGLHCCECD